MISLFEENLCLLVEDSKDSGRFLSVKKPGCFGWGNDLSPPSIRTTDAIIGLSSGACCTHSRPTWMHLNISGDGQASSKDSSISSNGLPSIHSFHAWKLPIKTTVRFKAKRHLKLMFKWVLAHPCAYMSKKVVVVLRVLKSSVSFSTYYLQY